MHLKICCCLLAFAFTSPPPCHPEQRFQVLLRQGDELIKPLEGVYNLKKAPFIIEIIMSDTMGVIVNASHNETTWKAATENVELEKLAAFEVTAFAENPFNKDEDVFVADTGCCYWYYDNDGEHRFNRTTHRGDGSIVAQRKIERLTYIGGKKPRSVKVKKVDKPLYLVFFSYDRLPGDLLGRLEIQRQTLKIEWKR